LNPLSNLKRSGSRNKIRELLQKAKELGMQFSVFTNTMTEGTWEDQRSKTVQTNPMDIEFYGILLFGTKELVCEITKKLPLWK
jgi:hypothetical protein